MKKVRWGKEQDSQFAQCEKVNHSILVLGIVGSELPQQYRNLFVYATTAARMIFAQIWKEEEVRTREEWLTEIKGICRNGET